MPDEPAIFISYRRRDAGGHGRHLHEYLSGRFGDDRIFFDRSAIESGDKFPNKLCRGVEGCAVLLALIGPEWLDVRGDDGGRRLDDADDFVRREIALALEQGKKVIPVLFDDTPVPPRSRLPEPLAALASCDALTLRGKTYEYQTQRRKLVQLLAEVPGVPEPLPEAGEAVATIGSVPPPQLGRDLADFTGRQQEIAALERALASEGGCAAIVGMGGVGKTALAMHVAHRLKDRYPDGQIVVDLKGTIEALSPVVAMGLVIVAFDPAHRLPDDERALAGLYRSLLSGKRLLILFDNAADAAQVRALLPAPPCGAIVTSRRAKVLTVVPSEQQVPLDVLAPAEADALLLTIIGDGRASAAERALLAERCGHLPFALRVAGTFLVSYADWAVAEYLAALADERERLKRLRIEDDALRDVAAALELSLRQLVQDSPELGERWRMLAVFAGGFEREAATAVWAVTPAEARDGLRKVVERSMLMFDTVKKRYRLHDLMRDLALGAANPLSGYEERRLAAARDRHSAHFQRILAEANALFVQGGEGVAAGLARFDQERANIEAGWRWLVAQSMNDKSVARRWRWLLARRTDKAMARRCSDYAAHGYALLPLRQPPREQIEWLEKALAAERRLGDPLRARAHLTNLGHAYHSLGDYRRAIEYHKQSLAIAVKIRDLKGYGQALGNLGIAHYRLGEYRRAIRLQEMHVETARQIGDLRGWGNALGNMGNAYDSLGEHELAAECHAQNIAIAQKIGDRLGESIALNNLGSAYLSLGEHRRAIWSFEQALAIGREIRDRECEGNALFNAALALDALGERTEAVARMQAAAVILTEIESPLALQAQEQLAVWQAER